MFADAAKPRGQHTTPRAGARRPWDGVRHPPAAVGPWAFLTPSRNCGITYPTHCISGCLHSFSRNCLHSKLAISCNGCLAELNLRKKGPSGTDANSGGHSFCGSRAYRLTCTYRLSLATRLPAS